MYKIYPMFVLDTFRAHTLTYLNSKYVVRIMVDWLNLDFPVLTTVKARQYQIMVNVINP